MRKNAVIRSMIAAGLIASAPFAHAAGNLVFCSEGSPAGFDPGQYTTGTDFDAAAETVFNRLTQFERGGTQVIPGLAEKWLEERSYLDAKGLVYLKQYQAHLELALGSRAPTAFRVIGTRALKEGGTVWVELQTLDGVVHALAKALWAKQEPGAKAEAGLSLVAFQKDEALRIERRGGSAG